MKVRAKKLAVLILAGALVLSGFTQPEVVNAEETGEKVSASEEMTEDTQEKQEKPEADSTEKETEKKEADENLTEDKSKEETPKAKRKTLLSQITVLKEDKQKESANGIDTIEELKTALEAGGRVELAGNIEYSEPIDIVITKAVTLDLKGHTVTSKAAKINHFLMVIGENGALTLEDSVGGGALKATDESYGYGIQLKGKNSSFVMNGGSIESTQETVDIYTIISDVTVEINGGKLVSKADNTLGIRGDKNINVKIKGGELISAGRVGFYVSSYKENAISLEISGGTVHNSGSGAAIQIYSGANVVVKGEAKITGGRSGIQLQAGAAKSSLEVQGGTITGTGWAGTGISVDDAAKLVVTGGEIVGAVSGEAIKEDSGSTADISVTGGTFKKGDKVSNMSQYLPSGMEQDENGQVVVDEKADAKIGDAAYDTLADAIKAVKDGETIELTRNVTDAEGISVPSGKNFTIDFKGKEYIVTGPGAGSPNTETNAFQFLKDSTITMKNGTIKVGENASKNRIGRIIQNYADLTLENMIFDTKNLGKNEDYALSFNNGDIIFKGNTSIHTSDADVIAFDVCKFSSYPSVNVTFDESFTGKIEGKIVYDSTDASTHTLTINGNGSFAGIDASTKETEKISEEAVKVYGGSFGESVEEYVADELKAELKKTSSKYPYSYYATMEEALANAGAGDVVKDLTAPEDTKVFTITLDYGYDNKVVTIQGTSVTLPELQREGYKFLGWFAGDKNYKPGEVEVTEDMKFTAKWEKVQTPNPKPEENPEQKPTQNQNDKPAANKSDKPVSKVPKTGDTANVAGYMMVMVLAAGMVVVALRKKRRV